MTLDQLRYFLETAKFQHLNRAALSLHISPSAVSSAIGALEVEYKCKLFNREGKGIRLTEKGQFLKVQTEKLFDQANAIALGLQSASTEFHGTYKIAGSHYLATHILSQLLPVVQNHFPNLSIELGSMATHRVISDVLSGEIDGGLCMGPLKHPDLKATEIYQGQMHLAARLKHPIFKLPTHQQLKKISNYPALIHKPVVGVDICDQHPMFEKFGLIPKIRCFWDSDDVAVNMMKDSDSWSMLPDFVITKHSKIVKSLSVPPGWNAPLVVSFIARQHRGANSLTDLLVTELRSLFK
jgi:DNA-binding transcriptional LysR family regulator